MLGRVLKMIIDKNIVDDGDVVDIQAHKRGGDVTFIFTLSHRAGNWQILLTEKELKALLQIGKDA